MDIATLIKKNYDLKPAPLDELKKVYVHGFIIGIDDVAKICKSFGWKFDLPKNLNDFTLVMNFVCVERGVHALCCLGPKGKDGIFRSVVVGTTFFFDSANTGKPVIPEGGPKKKDLDSLASWLDCTFVPLSAGTWTSGWFPIRSKNKHVKRI